MTGASALSSSRVTINSRFKNSRKTEVISSKS
jgi:hypothetical protein